jgi:GntR family transcriptional regulator/MocR family aminotransferase
MKRPPEGLGPVVTLDRRRARPLHQQLYDGYREAILDGRLRPGQRLPSTRTLAEDLGISRIPVVTAFAQLVAEGYIESRVGAGSFVSARLPDPPVTAARQAPADRARRPGVRRVPPSRLVARSEPWFDLRGPFRIAQPAFDEFPAALWARLVARHAQRLSPKQMAYGDPMGLPALREALAAHLRTFRSVACTPDQIMIVSGSQQALALAGQALLMPRDPVWLEEPGYPGARDALLLAAARIVPVPVDDDGLDVRAGIARSPRARAAYVTPSHHYPLGVVMSAARRRELLEWARRCGAWVIEDDYDSEYRYGGEPLASLHGLDGDARVLYIGTFSKILFPGLRVGYLVIPKDLVARFRTFRDAMDLFPATLYQAALAELVRDGHFARHLRRMRRIYGARRRALDAAIVEELGAAVRIVGDHAGFHLVVLLPPGARDHEIALRAAREGISVVPLSSCYVGRRTQPGLVLGFGSTRPGQMPEALRRLKKILHA